METITHQRWSSRAGFLLAAIGGAVGLGNIWKFPYMAGAYGGAAFVMIYLIAVFVVAVPVLIAELAIGRAGGGSPIFSLRRLVREHGFHPAWRLLGWQGVLTAFLVLSIFGSVASWVLAYLPIAFTNGFAGMTAAEARGALAAVHGDPYTLMAWFALFLSIAVYVIARGIRSGIEAAVKWMTPALAVILAVLLVYGFIEGDVARAFAFLFAPDFSEVTGTVILMAIGQAFVSVGVASGVMITFGAYLAPEFSIARGSIIIALSDTGLALLAGMAIYPIIFAHGIDPGQGPGLTFISFPLALGGLPASGVMGSLFFVLLLLAVLTSTFAVLEPIVAWLEEHKGIRRLWASIGAGAAAWLVSLVGIFAFNIWADVRPLAFLGIAGEMGIFDLLDFLITNLILPTAGIAIALFAGWRLDRHLSPEGIGMRSRRWYAAWRFSVRYIVPAAIAAFLAARLLGVT